MLKRIAWYGEEGDSHKAFVRAAKRKDACVVTISSGMNVPPGVSAIVADPSQARTILAAAVTLGTWNEAVVKLLAWAIDCREGFLPGSSVRVMDHATRFAKALKLSPDDQLALERGALLRDLGKIRIPNDVLLKQGVLTYEEWRLLQQHTQLGSEMAIESGAFKDIADIVRSHHECFDGDGYPDGLEGEAIPYPSRIVKILDVYCAMTSPRHYRKTHSSHEDAVAYFRSEQGKHFDPKLVEVFVEGGIGQTE